MRTSKRASESYTEQVQILTQEHMNGFGRLFGGTLMSWIDVVAAVVARRHSNRNVTTACVSELTFKAPAFANDTIVLCGHVSYVGRTSMEICVDSYVENLDGTRKTINKAYVTLVALDENGAPCEVPLLELETESQKKEFEEGQKRRMQRSEAANS
ncbi:MAG: acyl-CoA thioesterase [Clostridia bacterium]|nr:acyl-CoA thioesterase [Clostridia bacterium]